MDSVISWFILDVLAFYFGIRFAIRVMDEYDAKKKEQDDDEW